jgi:HTH-type transcriptional regulator/antitoxin HipB
MSSRAGRSRNRERKAAGLTQVQVAKKLRRYQSYITLLETGRRRLDVVAFMDIADAIGSTRQPR